MAIYQIERGQPQRRAAVAAALDGLELLSEETRDLVITAWVSVWVSSSHDELDAMPYSPDVPHVSLIRHVNEVCRTALDLARRSRTEWGHEVDHETFVPILLLHDIDKPLLYEFRDGGAGYTPLSKELPHGVIGAMLLRELGFDDLVVATVATHAMNAPFHGSTHEAFLLHYADLFSTDCILSEAGLTPFYQRHFV